MKRRALLTGLFTAAATVAIADPAHARRRRRSMFRQRRSRGYQPTSYTANSVDPPVERTFSRRREARVERPVSPQSVYSETRSQDGTLTEKQVYKFREMYADGQSRQAMRSALGDPAEQYWDRDVWKIQRLGIDGKPSGEFGRFEAKYDWGNGGWDGATTKPPRAEW